MAKRRRNEDEDTFEHPLARSMLRRSQAAQKLVTPPALCLMVAGVIEACWGGYDIVSGIRNVAARSDATAAAAAQQVDSGPLSFLNAMAGMPMIVFGGLGLIFAALIILGAIKMKNLQAYSLARTSSILAMLPCNYLCVLGLIFGLWSLAVLARPDVKEGFSS